MAQPGSDLITRGVDSLSSLLNESRRVYAFTGAGVSTESGIPDFRSPDGIWSKFQPVYFDEFVSSETARHEYWRQKCLMHEEFDDAAPNAGHRILAGWERQGRLQGTLTQNIDGLHQLAGSQSVLELHGTARMAACLGCSERLAIDPVVTEFRRTDVAPTCRRCGGPLKHATISFGQPLDEQVLTTAQHWMQQADLVLALGSSLVVHPAASLPQIAVRSGARLVIVNREPTPLDAIAHTVIRASIGDVLTRVAETL